MVDDPETILYLALDMAKWRFSDAVAKAFSEYEMETLKAWETYQAKKGGGD